MQKFKVTREALRKATAYSFSTYDTPAFYELEGELLEGGGTVEKCCGELHEQYPTMGCMCLCHNKKEESLENKLVKILAEHVGETGANEDAVEVLERLLKEHKCPLFNRETPKEEIDWKIKSIGVVPKEEVKLPNRLEYKSDTDIQIKTLADTINQLRDYLASKENK